MQFDVINEPYLSQQIKPYSFVDMIFTSHILHFLLFLVTFRSSPDRQTDRLKDRLTDRRKVIPLSPPCNMHRWAQKWKSCEYCYLFTLSSVLLMSIYADPMYASGNAVLRQAINQECPALLQTLKTREQPLSKDLFVLLWLLSK